eukprot:SAG11_NODE_4586_length_1841_cov_143.384615_1_plen_276_part_00
MKKNSSNSSEISGNTKQISPAINWFFTLNNYTKDDIKMFLDSKSSIVPKFVFQEETGESGTPHLQGYVRFTTKKRPKSVFDNKRIHWECCKNVSKAIAYCQKEDTRSGQVFYRGIEAPFVQKIDKLYCWQTEILNILKGEPDSRILYWYWEKKGCAGKTTFQKYIFTHLKGVLIVSGKATDMKHAVVNYLETTKLYPKIILCNIPRHSLNYVSYTGIEEVKDMFFHSGKYEGGQICGPCPHFIIFANETPEIDAVSKDRWVISRIRSQKKNKSDK